MTAVALNTSIMDNSVPTASRVVIWLAVRSRTPPLTAYCTVPYIYRTPVTYCSCWSCGAPRYTKAPYRIVTQKYRYRAIFRDAIEQKFLTQFLAMRVLCFDKFQSKARFPLAELTGRQHGPSTRLVETRARQHGPCWRVMETDHPSTRAVNSGRQLG